MESIKNAYHRYLRYFLSKDDSTATAYDKFMALAYAVRSEVVDRWIETQRYYHGSNVRRVYYLSMEYVLGKSLQQNIINAGLENEVNEAASDLGFSLDELSEQEDDFELGYGTKGRSAASLQESMATHGVPAVGYGIRYDYSQFKQRIVNGAQVEYPNDWLHKGHPWEIVRPEYSCTVYLNGSCVPATPGAKKSEPHKWTNADKVIAVPYDLPIPGYRGPTVNTLRLWSGRASEEFLPDYLNHGDYVRACEDISQSGRITRVLLPEEDVLRVTAQRIRQNYFLISATLQDIVRRYKQHNQNVERIDEKVMIQLNGSRCAIAIAEMLRLLVDQEGIAWDQALKLTQNMFAYTTHAVSREHLEMWPVYLVAQILPRHMDIIYELNQHQLDSIRKEHGENLEIIRELSVIEEGDVKRVKMAQLAIFGSCMINGVSRTQTEILMKKVHPQVSTLFPAKFRSITDGASVRRWLLCGNSLLSGLITEAIGDSWIRNPEDLGKLESIAADSQFMSRLDEVKKIDKQRLLISVQRKQSIEFDSDALFDVQCKKVHPHKRQVLHVLNILHRYLRMRDGSAPVQKRLHVFTGKTMPSDLLGKQIVSLIHVTAKIINSDAAVRDKMGVLFIPDYGMSWAEKIIPAAELSEEISTPNLEPCSTSNIKLALNGALPMASLSGTNLEMIERIGSENMFTFGRSGQELEDLKDYRPGKIIEENKNLGAILRFLESSISSIEGGDIIYPLLSSLRDNDRYRVLLDFDDYVARQDEVDVIYQDRFKWLGMSLKNIARCGWFSSDRAVHEYARHVWKVDTTD